MASLVYEPLIGDQFRLLTLLPGTDGPVKCGLRNVRFGECSFHEEGIYWWKKREAIEIKRPSSFSRRITRPMRRLRTGGRKPERQNMIHVGAGYHMASSGGADQDGSQKPIEWTRDQLPFVPEYEALSYAWGAPIPIKSIIVNDCMVNVRQNLYAAFMQLRDKSKPRELWVDAICIDQLNLEERAVQVARMPAIYQRARHVIAWLGAASETSSKAFELLEQLGQHEPPKKTCWYEYHEWLGPQFDPLQRVGSLPEHAWNQLPEDPKKSLIEHLRSRKQQKTRKKIDDEGQQALQNLLTRTYWKRVWIIQEIAYARDVTFVCGGDSLDWLTFDTAISRPDCDAFPDTKDGKHWFCYFLQNSGIMLLRDIRWRTRQPWRAHGFEARSSTLLRMLELAWSFQSSDPRDKIYALLGLPSVDDDMCLPSLDYGRSVSHVFCEIAKAIIRYERALNILCLQHASGESQSFGLPSWAPDWTNRPEPSPILFQVFPSRPKYAAAGLTCAEGPDWEVFEDGRRIDLWAHSMHMGLETQNGPFRKRPNASVTKPPSTREERADEYDDRAWQLRGTEYFDDHDGLTIRRLGSLPSSEQDDPFRLVVDGLIVSHVVSDNRAVTPETVATGEWKDIIREWERLDETYLLTPDENSGPFPPLAHFLWTFTKGHFGRMSDKEEMNWLTVFYEKYLVWTGRLEIDSAKYRSAYHLVDDVESVLKGRTVGWKFAISDEGHFAMVPARTREGDLICVLFGADLPMILRRRSESTSEPSYEFLGPAYVHQIMFGQALEEFRSGRYHRVTFAIT